MCSEKMSVLSRTTPRSRTLDEKVKDGKVFARRAKSSLRSCCRLPNQISWFLAAICPYSRVIVGVPDSHVQRICPGLLHVSGRRCTTWKTVSSHSSQMTTAALLVTCPVHVDDLRETKLFRLILSLTSHNWLTRHSLTNVSYCFCSVCSRFRIELINNV